MASKITLYDTAGNPQELSGDDIAQMGGMPVGGLINFGGVTAPAGFLICDGTEVAQATYPDLYGAIGDVWGVAVDPLNFVLPNQAQNGLGNFMRGVGAVAVGDYQVDAFKEHIHTFMARDNILQGGQLSSGADTSGNERELGTSSSGNPTETRPVSMTTLMCIKAIHAVENLALVNVTQLMAEMQANKIISGDGWIKYPDGTMICYGLVTATTPDHTNVFAFPHPFIASPFITMSNTSGTTSFVEGKIERALTTTTQFSFGILIKASGSMDNTFNDSVSMQFQAIGRWK